MITPEISYFLKVNIAIIIFYSCYRLFFYKDTFFRSRRFILISFLLISFSYPLLNLQEWMIEKDPIHDLTQLYTTFILPEYTVTTDTTGFIKSSSYITKVNLLLSIYLIGVMLLITRFFISLINILLLVHRSSKQKINGTSIRVLNKLKGSFSFFKWIFLNPLQFKEEEIKEILIHEYTHVKQYHSLDIIISEIACIICWPNPFIWLIKQEIRYNLEYLADYQVIKSGHNRKSYQYHLLEVCHQNLPQSLYTNFNVLSIKTRIKMMNKKRTKELVRTKYIILIPLTIGLLLISNIELIARMQTTSDLDQITINHQNPKTYKGTVVNSKNRPIAQANIIIKNSNQATTTDSNGYFIIEADPAETLSITHMGMKSIEIPLKNITNEIKIQLEEQVSENQANSQPEKDPGKTEDSPIFTVVEKMPEYPGGMGECFEFIRKHIQYPVEALNEKIEGRVILQMVINEEGKVTNVEIARSAHPYLDEEAIRVINLMPDWIPGTQKGKPVKVKYTLPLTFKLPQEEDQSQIITNEEENKEEKLEKMAEYPGGMEECLKFLAKNIKYPKDAQQAKIQGRVIAQIVVGKEGDIEDVKILRSIHPSLDREAVRVLKLMPKWSPGIQKGKAVKTKFTIPVNFRLNK